MSISFTANMINIRGNKNTICSIALIAVLALSTFAILLPKVSGQATGTGVNLPQWAYINAFPTPTGVGQPINIFAWTANLPPTANGAYGDRWNNITIIETLPDGTKTTLGPYISDPVGTTFQTITPTVAGNYTFQAIFPGHVINNVPNGIDPTQMAQAQAYAAANNVPLATAEARFVSGWSFLGDYYAPATSDIATVTVQSTAIPYGPAFPLPAEYWSTPVSQSGHSPNWIYVTGDWLAQGIAPNYSTMNPENAIGGNINDFTQPPTSAHIAWTKPINFGGVAGNPQAIPTGGDNYYSYLSYETMNAPGIILNGQYYFNTPNPPEYGFMDVSLTTGQVVWYQNGTDAWAGTNSPNPLQIGGFNKNSYPQLSFAQEMDYESPNQHGMIDTLWAIWTASNGSSVWSAFDPMTGNWECNLWNVPGYAVSFSSPSLTTDPFGDMLIYTTNLAAKTLTIWNSTSAIENTYETSSTLSQNGASLFYGNSSNSYWFYRPALGQQIDARMEGNTVFPITGTIPTTPSNPLLFAIDQADQEMIFTTLPAVLGTPSYPTPNNYYQFAISINPTTMGQVLWSQTYTRPAGNVTVDFSQNYLGNGVFAMFQKETRLWMAFSAHTGDLLWTSPSPELDNHMYGVTGGMYNGVIYSGDSSGTGGNVYAYNSTTGTLLFDSQTGSFGYGGYWVNTPASIKAFAADNVYIGQTEHSPGPNLEPGEILGDINATTGAPIWNITCWPGAVSIADGYLVCLNNYDNQLYAFAKGPTQTTVGYTWSNTGQNLVIQGSVLDKSAGTTQPSIAMRFPNGVAAVSDASQTPWMEYVYMQNPAPTSATGVPVGITLIDPNGNIINEPSVTSDTSGHYSLNYKVSSGVPGTYTALATFSGSNSYWPSYSETSFTVDNAAKATPVPTATPTSVADMYFIPAIAGLFVLIIVGLIVLALLVLRKRP
ncbi:MAG: PQQ-binding-like beta-propeller repeat protein [Candidatus Bathyarchaeia archaeon]